MRGYITGWAVPPQAWALSPACNKVTLSWYRHLSILLMGLERCTGVGDDTGGVRGASVRVGALVRVPSVHQDLHLVAALFLADRAIGAGLGGLHHGDGHVALWETGGEPGRGGVRMEKWEGDTPTPVLSLPNELPWLHPLLSSFLLQPIRSLTWCPTLGRSTHLNPTLSTALACPQ